MSAAEAERNPVLQLIEQFSEWERTLDCEAFFTQKIFPLSARALRRLLTSQDDALLLVLNNMQSHGNALTYICRCSVVMLVKALGFDGNPTFSSDLRLFVKLLLRHVDLLCNSTKNMCACFDSMCKNLLAAAENRRQLDAHTLEAMLSDVGAVAGILGVFLRLLQEARSATPIRAMASILGCLLVYYGAAFAVIYEGAVPSGHSLQAELLKVMQTTAIIAERIMATLPADCVDDDTARSFIPTESFAHVNTSLSSSSRLSHHQPPWPTDTPIRDILPGLLSKKIIFNDQYVLSVLNETGSSGVTKAAQAMLRTGITLTCKLPEQQLRRIIHKSQLGLMSEVRKTARRYDWYDIPPVQRVCFASGCGKHGASFKVCSGCYMAEYCGAECQRKDWPAHKAMCKHWKKGATQDAKDID